MKKQHQTRHTVKHKNTYAFSPGNMTLSTIDKVMPEVAKMPVGVRSDSRVSKTETVKMPVRTVKDRYYKALDDV